MNQSSGGLAQLLETESRLAEALAAAEAEAAGLLRSARAAAAAEESGFQRSVDAAASALAERLETERAARARKVAAAGAARSRRFREVPDSLVDQLAAEVVRRVLADPDGERP